jgi:hypothetical protein
VITTNGNSRRKFMLPEELKEYEAKGFVVRGKVEEGKKMFFSWQTPGYLRENWFKDFEVLEYVEASFPHTGQDHWILRKPAR